MRSPLQGTGVLAYVRRSVMSCLLRFALVTLISNIGVIMLQSGRCMARRAIGQGWPAWSPCGVRSSPTDAESRRPLAPHRAGVSLHVACVPIPSLPAHPSADHRTRFGLQHRRPAHRRQYRHAVLDVPPHSVARPELKREKSGPLGLAYTDKIEPWQFGGEACVVDVRDLLDQAPKGVSPLVKAEHVLRFERHHRPLRFGDVVLFRSDYSDKYYQPFPDGRRFLADALDRKAPAYPDPDPDCMEFLATRGVMTPGTDSASMGPLPDLAEPTHYAGLRHGMIWAESATNLGVLPPVGGFFCLLAPKHEGGPYSEARAFSIVGGTPSETDRVLQTKARDRPVSDAVAEDARDLPGRRCGATSPGLSEGRLPLRRAARHVASRPPHGRHGGYHLVPPAFALPAPGTEPAYPTEVAAGWLTMRGNMGRVVEHEHDEPAAGGVDQALGRGTGWCVRATPAGLCVRATQAGSLSPCCRPRQRAEHAIEHLVGQQLVVGGAGEDDGAPLAGLGGHPPVERRLAGPGYPGDDDHRRPARLRLGQQVEGEGLCSCTRPTSGGGRRPPAVLCTPP